MSLRCVTHPEVRRTGEFEKLGAPHRMNHDPSVSRRTGEFAKASTLGDSDVGHRNNNLDPGELVVGKRVRASSTRKNRPRV